MMGRSHLIGGTAVAATAGAGVAWLARPDNRLVPELHPLLAGANDWITTGATWLVDKFVPWGATGSPTTSGVLLAAMMALLFWVGCLFADVDSEHTMLGRRLHLPLRHRGWTHTDWVLWPLVGLAWLEPTGLLAWFVLGHATHLFLDELSKAGRVHWYPITKYKVYVTPDGREVVVKQRWQGLYKAGKMSEYLVLGVVVLIALAASWAVWWPAQS